ncbi:MAG TPA: DNRLRE domain-containing protein [Candidatus Sabulitectum sp.]|nr:DNRLRE domain-containing protein [Candidatus Sabulitectum sp.]HPF32943.1 DNRLRE domain-containing protein [Candidatus Sabulitectum sp.]HPJ29419.1 DNRLRE domain-containing protein [Candidatus Sabulitectum sp.]HPR21649.1 DNRLRE domain-containing protein [Candidatus Sabulitectum sp.]HRW77781.1 DNRLRE domain-containing protein [Candidatus Sabulitectum sp.]
MKTAFPCLWFLVLGAMAGTVVVNPIADMTTTPTGAATTTAYVEICHRPAHGHPDTRGAIVFDLSGHAGWTAESAILNLDVFYQSGCGLPTSFNTWAATEEWDETWSGTHLQQGSDNWGMFTFSGTGWYQMDITDLVNAWLSGSASNYGLVFQAVDSNQAEHRFYSSNAVDPEVRPFLSITFPESFDQMTWTAIKNSF